MCSSGANQIQIRKMSLFIPFDDHDIVQAMLEIADEMLEAVESMASVSVTRECEGVRLS